VPHPGREGWGSIKPLPLSWVGGLLMTSTAPAVEITPQTPSPEQEQASFPLPGHLPARARFRTSSILLQRQDSVPGLPWP
jgi:hypothetical protein